MVCCRNYIQAELEKRKAPAGRFQVMLFDLDEDRYSVRSSPYKRRGWALRRARRLTEYAKLRRADSIETYFVSDDQGNTFDP